MEDEVRPGGPGVCGMPNGYGGVDPEGETTLENCGYKRDFWRNSFKGVADSIVEARTRKEGMYWGRAPFLRHLSVLVAQVRVLSCQGDGEGGGRRSAVEGRKRPRRAVWSHMWRGHVAVAGGQACSFQPLLHFPIAR